MQLGLQAAEVMQDTLVVIVSDQLGSVREGITIGIGHCTSVRVAAIGFIPKVAM